MTRTTQPGALLLSVALLLAACAEAESPTGTGSPAATTPAPTAGRPPTEAPGNQGGGPPAEPGQPGTPPAQAEPPTEPSTDSEDPFDVVVEIVADVEPSVVTVLADTGLGSGIIYGPDGAIVTNHHVIAGADQIEVALATGERLEAEVVGSDPQTDVAVLRIDATDLPMAAWDTDLPRLGALAIAIGSPLGFHNSVTVGVVSGVQRAIPGSASQTQALVDLIQTDAAISPGNSGGALVDADGEVIGMAVAHIPPQAQAVSIGFAIPASTVVGVADSILAGEPVEHAFLGVRSAPVTPELAEQFGLETALGAVVLETVPGGPADEAGVETGDVIVGLAGEPITRVEDMLASLRRLNPGDVVDLTVVRNGDEQVLQVELTERP